MNECNFPTCGCQTVYGAPWCKACLSIMSPPKPHEPAEIMRDKTAQIDEFKKSLVESSGYFTWADTENHRKEFGGSRITACGVTYEYGTHPLAALAMRERAAEMTETHIVETQFDGSRVVVPSNLAKEDQHHRSLAEAIRALPTTFSDAELLAAAMQLPEVRALVEAAGDMKKQLDERSYTSINMYTGNPERHFGVWPSTWSAICAALAPFTKGGE
jgi:hypothetical protein